MAIYLLLYNMATNTCTEIFVERAKHIIVRIPEIEKLPVYSVPLSEQQFLEVLCEMRDDWFKKALEKHMDNDNFMFVINRYFKKMQYQRATALYIAQWLTTSNKFKRQCLEYVERQLMPQAESLLDEEEEMDWKPCEAENNEEEVEEWPEYYWKNKRDWYTFCHQCGYDVVSLTENDYAALDDYYCMEAECYNKRCNKKHSCLICDKLPQAESGIEQQDLVAKEQNVVFTDQRETTEDTGYITTQVESNLKSVSMPEDDWHVKNIMSKPIPFWTSDWKVSDTEGKTLQGWTIPGGVMIGPHYNLMSTFTFFRGHPKIRLQINGTKFHQGRLIAAFIPNYSVPQFDEYLYSVSALTSMPHVMLDASIANSGIIDLPFVHMNTYFNTLGLTRTWQSLGRLIVVVFNKLRAADTASQNIGVTAWISYDNCELHQPCYAHVPSLPGIKEQPHAPMPQAESAVEGLLKATAPLLTDLVGDVTGGASNQDKPTDPTPIQRWVPNAVTGLCHGDGMDRGERLCLNPMSYTVPDATLISTTRDDMDLRELCKIPVRFATFEWKDSQGTGTRLAHLAVNPTIFSNLSTSKDVSPAVEIIEPTLLGYIARYFKFWRGGLRYKLQIISSQMHTGRLMIAYGAGQNLVNRNMFNPMSYMNTYIVDLQEKHEVEFTVPFFCERPWLRCDRFYRFDKELADAEQLHFESLGFIDIYVMNRLSHPAAVSSDVDVNVFISAAEDFELAVPSELSAFQGIGNPIPVYMPQAESLSTQETVTTRTEEGPIILGKGSGRVAPTGPSTMGENAMNLKSLLRRYCKVFANNRINITDAANFISFVNTPTLSGVNSCFGDYGVQTRTALTHFSELFTFWRGSLRYKLIVQVSSNAAGSPLTGNFTYKVFHVPGVFSKGNFTPKQLSADERAMYAAFESQGTMVASSGIQASVEFEVPFYTPYTQLRTINGEIPNSRTATGQVFVIFDAPAYFKGNLVSLELYQSAGDDFTLNYLRAAPRVQFIDPYETKRNLEDNADFIFSEIPPICSGLKSKKFLDGTMKEVNYMTKRLTIRQQEDVPQAESLTDYIPGARTMKNVSRASAKVETVCDTANHILQQAAKKIGVQSGDDEEDNTTTTLTQDMQTAFASLTPALESILDYVKLLPTHVSEYFKVDNSAADLAIDAAALVSGLYSTMQAESYVIKICGIVTVVSSLLKGCSTTIKNKIYHFTTQVLEVMNPTCNGSRQVNQLPKAESLGFDLVAPLTATLAVGVGAIGFKKIPTDKETMDMCKGISEKLRLFNFSSLAMQNVKKVWTEVKELLQWCIDYVMNLVAPHLLAQLKLEREFGNIEEWTQFIDSLDNISYADKIHYDYEFRNKIFRAIDSGKRYNILLLEGKCGRAANVIREYVRKVTEIGLHCERSKNELPFRKDPFCIFMTGETDIGKSGCITSVGFDIMDALDYPRHNRWCAINCTEKFFSENYRQQSAVYFDDFSTFTSEEQYMNFFNLKANTAYPLDMAFRKGEYFNSDFIFGTTNTPYPQPNFITHHDALHRRRDLLVEAFWNDDEEIQEALQNGRNMAPFRRLDNTHLKFRFLNPRNERAPPGAWMTYIEMVNECVVTAREHLQRQQTKLTHDLTRAGYIVPRAEAGEVRRLCLEAIRNSPSLSLFDPELWQHLEWDSETQQFQLFSTRDEEWPTQWDEVQHYFRVMNIDLHQTLKNNSYIVRNNNTLVSKVKTALTEFKNLITSNLTEIMNEHPWIATIGKWSVGIAASIATLYMMGGLGRKIVHKCVCKALRHYGYRCGLCGRWPAMADVKPTMVDFMQEQWRSLYGSVQYKDHHITSPKEEAALLSVMRKMTVEMTDPYIGTVKQAESYSDTTRGAKVHKITAQGTYDTGDKGIARTKISAQGTHYSEHTPGQSTVKISAQSETLITNRIFPYLYRIKTMGKEGLSSSKVNCYAIGDRFVIINKHFFYGLTNGDEIQIYHNGAWLPFEFNTKFKVDVPNKDFSIYQMPIQFHAHKDNTHHFISENELANFRGGIGSLCKLDHSLNYVQIDNLNIKPLEELNFELTMAGESIPLYVQRAWQYNKCSSYGDCGSPLIAHTNKISGKILGIHVASCPTKSYAQLITREMLEPYVKRKEGTPQPIAEAILGNLIPPGHYGRIGRAPAGKGFFQKGTTQIIPTAIAGRVAKIVTEPTVLTISDPRLEKRVNPLRNGIEKYGQVAKPFPYRYKEIVNEMMQEETRLLTRVREPKLLTLEQASIGIKELEHFDRLPKNTSPGYPWILNRPSGECGKAYLFDDETGTPVFELRKAFEWREEKARQCERVESVWVDCLKDERRTLDKIKSGSTRLFTIPPVDYSLLMRKYTMDYSVAVQNSRAFQDCKVGINCQSMEWTELYYWLAEFSPHIVAGDFSRFDGTIPADLILDFCEDINFFYRNFSQTWQPEDDNARIILFDELVHTIHLAKQEFYMTHIGNKSGNPLTVILNSKINRRYMAFAWLGLSEEQDKMEMHSMEKFRQNVRMATYGDDNLLAIKPEVITWYNQETISEYLQNFGIIYTNEEKSGVTKFKTLDECTFLKQGFANHELLPLVKVPHMKMTTITELFNWTRIAPDQDVLLYDNITDALRFLYFRGKQIFNVFRNKALNALEEVGKKHMPPTYTDMHLWFLHTIGVLQQNKAAEGYLEDISQHDTTLYKRLLMATTLGPLAWLLVKPVRDDNRIRTDRLAICIPSGEGKSWLCSHYPHLFVDHDSLSLPQIEKMTANIEGKEKLLVAANELLNPQKYDTSEHDRRILLTHHPNSTNRTIWRQYVLPYPNFNRNNLFNRLILDSPIKLSQADRNKEMVAFAQDYINGKFDQRNSSLRGERSLCAPSNTNGTTKWGPVLSEGY